MKKILIILSIFFLINGLIPLGFNNNIASAVPTSITLENWEGLNVGSTNASYFKGTTNASFWTWESSLDNSTVALRDNQGTGTKSLYVTPNVNLEKMWFNFTTDFDYIEGIRFNMEAINEPVGSPWGRYHWIYYNDGVEVIRWKLETFIDAGFYFQAVNDSWVKFADFEEEYDNFTSIYVMVEHYESNLMTYSLHWYSNDTLIDSKIGPGRTQEDWNTIDQFMFEVKASAGANQFFYLDDIVITIGTGPPGQKSFYVNFFDIETGLYFDYFNLIGPIHPSSMNRFISGSLSSDINNDLPYALSDAELPVELTGSFSSGSWHWINLTGINTWIQDENKAFFNFSTYIQIYEGQTYNFGLTEVAWSEERINLECGNHYSWFHNWPMGHTLEYCLSSDKIYYDVGETVNIRYKLPTIKDLVDHGVDSSGWEMWIYDYDNVTNIFGILWFDNGDSADLVYTALVYDRQWHEVNFDPKTPGAGANKYICIVAKPGLIGSTELIYKTYLTFYVTPTAFTPSGNITAISPIDPVMGQAINITWDANNNGKLVYRNVYDPGSIEHTISGFTKFTGSKQLEFSVWDLGEYIVNLYVSDGELDQLVDTSIFWVNDTNGSLGGFGYGIEFLTVAPFRAIAGYDNVKINYKTLIDDTKITVIDGRGQTTPYGTMANNGTGRLHFKLPPDAPIGNWTITMYANETHNTSFYVIADENNYFKFMKHIYYEGEPLTLSIVHDKKIALTFYKNEVAQGQDIVFDIQQQTIGLYTVPLTIIEPSEGIWACEMWEVNNLIKIRLLARDTCKVVFLPVGKPIDEGFGSILGMIAMSSDFFGGGSFGLMVISLIIIVSLILALSYIKADGSTITLVAIITCLALVYIGWMPAWIGIIAVVFTGLMFGEALSKKLNLGGKK